MTPLALWLPFICATVVALSVCLYRSFLVRRYGPVQAAHHEASSVVSPVFREDERILECSVQSWLDAGADEVILVIPAEEEATIAHARRSFAADLRVQILVAPTSAKRPNVAFGVIAARKPIVVLADSDTIWEPDALSNLLRPFADPSVGGVGTRPRVLASEGSVWRRIADWLFDAKYLRQVPATSAAGAVSCLSGRTVAYRRELVVDVVPELVDEMFAGTACVSGDDGRLTWLVLQSGYQTVYQGNAVVWTMAPETMRGFVMQRLRFARNDYRNYLRAIAKGWLRRQPLATRLFILQVLLGPVWVVCALAFSVLAAASGELVAASAWAAASLWGQGLMAPTRWRDPRSILYLPLVAAITVIGLNAIKVYAASTLRRQGWLTRRGDADVPEGQSARSIGWALEPAHVTIEAVRNRRR
jgi:N-acetylglucosaminyltransferase